VFCRFKT